MVISRAKARLAQPAMKCVCPHCGITNWQRKNTTNPVVYQPRPGKRKHFWATLPCRAERYINCDPQKESISGTAAYQSAVYQPRSAKQKHTVAAIYQQRSGHQSDSTAGRHRRDFQSGMFTAICKPKAHMTQLLSPAP